MKRAPHPLLRALGARVRALRQEGDLTLAALADRAGLSLRFVSDLESGRANISVLNLAELAQALGVTPSSLMDAAPSVRQGVVSLLGLRGAGKSTVGPLLAARLGVPFFELDRLVEAKAGMESSEIFAIHGEDFFRRLEWAALKRFLNEHAEAVLATGGGLVSSPDALQLLLDRTFTVWLRATPEEHWERVVAQGDLRPIANRPSAMAELRRRLREREPLYGRARLTCATSGRGAAEVVADVARNLGLARAPSPRMAR